MNMGYRGHHCTSISLFSFYRSISLHSFSLSLHSFSLSLISRTDLAAIHNMLGTLMFESKAPITETLRHFDLAIVHSQPRYVLLHTKTVYKS
jgi:hypothetical protein